LLRLVPTEKDRKRERERGPVPSVSSLGDGLRAGATDFYGPVTEELPRDTWEPRFDRDADTGRVRSVSVATMYLVQPADCTSNAMAYDAARERVVLFGGRDPFLRNDTWELVSGAAPGSECTSGEQCVTGYCVDGVCCDSACDAEGHVCDEGECVPAAEADAGIEPGDGGPEVVPADGGCGCTVLVGSGAPSLPLALAFLALLLRRRRSVRRVSPYGASTEWRGCGRIARARSWTTQPSSPASSTSSEAVSTRMPCRSSWVK